MGTLNLYRRTPDSLQKELAQSDHRGLRKRPKHVIRADIPNSRIISYVLDVFSAPCRQNDLILFEMSQTSCEFRVPTTY